MGEPRELLQLLQRIKRGYEGACRPLSAKYGLTQNEIDVLLFLSNNPGHDTARDIVELRALSKSHVCKSVDALTRRGWLAGRQDARDRRCVHLSLLPAALPAAEEAKAAQRQFFQGMLRGIDPADLQVMGRVLEQVGRQLREAQV